MQTNLPPHPGLQTILTTHIEIFQPLGLTTLILFGSFARGEEKEHSDVDICLIFENLDSDKKKKIWDLERKSEKLDFERKIDRIIVTRETFQKETAPIYTSIKNTGKIIFGEVDLTLNDLSYKERYAEFFKRSKEVESRKVESAEEFILKLDSTETDFLYIPAKHTIQAYLAMKGQGFTSNFEKLYKLTFEVLGEEYAKMFLYLFQLNENQLHVTKEECLLGLEYAKKILSLYTREI